MGTGQTNMLACWGCRTEIWDKTSKPNDLERSATEGDSPVGDYFSCPIRILSTAEHEKFRWNLGRPFPKPKYYLVTDSEPVP